MIGYALKWFCYTPDNPWMVLIPAPLMAFGLGGLFTLVPSMVADVVDVVRALTSDPENRVPHLAFQPAALADTRVLPMDEVKTSYYLRMQATDKPGVLADVTSVLGKLGISIEAILQKEPAAGAAEVPIIMLTHTVRERQMNAAIGQIESLGSIHGSVTRIRLEHLDCD